jgi:hypothetical protein
MPPLKHPTVPIDYAGKWIAWNHAMTHIVASGNGPSEILEAAKNAGESEPILSKVPRGVLASGRLHLKASKRSD